MITETEAYKGRKFTCDNCDYVVSSDAMSDFDVDDFVWYMGDVRMKKSIPVKDLLDYSERGADICQKLHHDALERYGTTGNASDISAMAYFMQRENMLRYEMTNIVKVLASMDKQPEDCIFGYGTCCYPIEECQNCPNRNGGE